MELLNQAGIIQSSKTENTIKETGLGGLLFLTDCLIQLHKKTIQLNDLIEIEADIQAENSRHRVKFYEGELYSVSHLLRLYIITQSPQITLILSRYLNPKTKKKSIDRVHALATSLGFDSENIANITGRQHRDKKQEFNIYDLEKIAKKWLTLSTPALKLLQTTHVEHRNEIFELHTKLFELGVVTHAFNWQAQQVFIGLNKSKQSYAIALDYGDTLTHDIAIETALNDKNLEIVLNNQDTNLKDGIKAIDLGEFKKINIAGDFYLGEWYSRRRLARNIIDRYSQDGAAYCYEYVRKLFPEDELNIVNSESTVVDFDHIESPYTENKKFILDANPKKIFAALEDLNVKAVFLANNHSYDFGPLGLAQSIEYFQNAKIPAIGAGQNLDRALDYYKVNVGTYNLYIFSVYWYRGNQYFDYDCYAKPNKSGVASINHYLFDKIKEIKKQDEKAFVLVSPHWGVDFKPTSSHQRNLATQLIEAGTDLIIGHGAHSLQSIEKISGKYVVFSLGNFVFNSDGEFDTHKALKYGLFAQLDFTNEPKLILRGLDADNLTTQFKPALVNENQYEQIRQYYGVPLQEGIITADQKHLSFTIPLNADAAKESQDTLSSAITS